MCASLSGHQFLTCLFERLNPSSVKTGSSGSDKIPSSPAGSLSFTEFPSVSLLFNEQPVKEGKKRKGGGKWVGVRKGREKRMRGEREQGRREKR